MTRKSIFKYCATITLLTCSMSVFAFTGQVKCPSAETVKSKLPEALNQVTRIESNRFDVRYDDLISDEINQKHWYTDVFVNTTKDSDFNEAYAIAKNSISSIVRPDRTTTDGVCLYLNNNGEVSGVELYLYETNELKMKQMHVMK